ncbi:MAG: LamG domain-containing protein, partial [Candidatus Doudnabacteria bacterium]|nr:LamG domain-containing protein [Candidatus Doudnabacteria bacterium]
MKKYILSIVLVAMFSSLLLPSVSFAALNSLNGNSTGAQFLATSTATTTSMHMKIVPSGSDTHEFRWDSTPWRIDQGGTGVTSSFISGALFFFSNNVFSQNANLFWDTVTSSLGIGNSSPQHKLDVTGAIYSRLVTLTDSPQLTVNWNSGNVQKVTLNANTEFFLSNGQAGGDYKLILKQDATGGRTVTWPASIKWPGGTTPTLSTASNGTAMVSFVYDGTNYLGSYSEYSTASTLTDNIVRYWKLDEPNGNASDSVGSLTLTNNNSTAYASARINNGADIERGSNNFLDTQTDIQGSTLTAYSISLWFKPESTPASGETYILASNADTPGFFRVRYQNDSGTVRLRYQQMDESDTLVNLDYTVTLATTTFSHIVATWNGSTLTLYHNGSSVGTPQSLSTISSAGNTYGFALGSDPGAAGPSNVVDG